MLLKPCASTLSSSSWVTRGLPQAVSSAPMASRVLPRFQPGCMAATVAIASSAAPWWSWWSWWWSWWWLAAWWWWWAGRRRGRPRGGGRGGRARGWSWWWSWAGGGGRGSAAAGDPVERERGGYGIAAAPRAEEAEGSGPPGGQGGVIAQVRRRHGGPRGGDGRVPDLGDLLAGRKGPGQPPGVDRGTVIGDVHAALEPARPLTGHLVLHRAAGGRGGARGDRQGAPGQDRDRCGGDQETLLFRVTDSAQQTGHDTPRR